MNNLIEQFKNKKVWVNWVYKTVGGKQTKVPFAKSNDPETWSTYEDLANKKNVGIMFGVDNMFMGCDIDHCIENGLINHEEKGKIESFLDYAQTYTEVSPSGSGLHLYFQLSEPLELITNKKAPFEVYTSHRFFTVTQNLWQEEAKPVRTISKDEALELLKMIGYPWGKEEETVASVETEATPTSNSTLTNDEIISRMFLSKNGAKIKALYDGDTSEYNNDESSADLALCNNFAFWTARDAVRIEELWLASPLGKREKTQNRKDYRDRTIKTAIKSCTEVYDPSIVTLSEYSEIDYEFLFKIKGKEKQKIITLCLENIAKILRLHPEYKGKFRFDDFKGQLEYKRNYRFEPFEDSDIGFIQIMISTHFSVFQTVSKDMVYDAICVVAFENRYDSAVDYIKSTVWDKKPRLDTWLCETYGVPDDVYHRAVASNWMKGLVKRIIVPGCKFDYVLVLEGPQGTRKSSSLGVLGGDWHVETTMSTDSKDFFMQFQGKAIVEFSEGETLSRTEVKRMKAIITTQVDKFRAPYGRVSVDHPRRCVFAMTTNSSEYLKDETGNRRWLPVATVFEKANLEWLAENRDQLFAEAYERVITGKETTYEFPEEETRAAQDARRISDPNTQLVYEWYWSALKPSERDEGITVLQVHIQAFGNQFNKKMSRAEEMSIAGILRDYLKLNKDRVMVAGSRAVRWFPPDAVVSDYKDKEFELIPADTSSNIEKF